MQEVVKPKEIFQPAPKPTLTREKPVMAAPIHVNNTKENESMKTASVLGDATAKTGPILNRASSFEPSTQSATNTAANV